MNKHDKRLHRIGKPRPSRAPLASQNRNEIETRTVIDGKKKDNRNEKTD